MKYPGLLDDDISRVGTNEAQMYNLLSGMVVADLVKTCLGPRGMSKMYIDILGEDTLTKHGGAFLRKVDVDHPAAKSVIDAVNTVDTHVGDGTSSAAILMGSLLGNAKKLLNLGIPTSTIVRGYEMGLDLTLDTLDEIKIKQNNDNLEKMRELLITCITGKTIFDLQEDQGKIVDMIIEAVLDVADLKNNHFAIDDIKIEDKIGNITEIQLIKGTLIDKTIDSSAMPKCINDAKILLINEPLETMKTRYESEIEITSPEQMSQFLVQENNDLDHLVQNIVNSGANVVISRKGVSDFVQESLAKKGIISMRRVKYNDLWWLEKAVNAKTCESIEKISSHELGFARKIYEKTVGGDPMVFVEGKSPKSVTILLRANSKRYLDELHRNILNAFHVLQNFIENPFVVCGAGSVEGILSQKIKEQSVSINGKEQLAVEKFADSILEIPLTLARNVGMDVLDTKTRLQAKFANSNGKTKWYGINSETRNISDMSSSKIIETVAVKQQIFKTAVEATNLILSVNDVFMKNIIDNTHCHVDGVVHAHHDPGKNHNHFEQEGLEQRQMHQYY
uniref:Thermosome subunit n=1 Tax=uncultured marine thaumarchaeote KM3_41_H02 TaxID=1456146 RepID=A0A075H1L3_9ARCH|nr:thermosome subunit [uncultured marine thaumarchaeote KM3_41_H02]